MTRSKLILEMQTKLFIHGLSIRDNLLYEIKVVACP